VPTSAASPRPIGHSHSAAALAALRHREPRNISELATRMRDDYQVRLAEAVLAANLRAARVTITTTGNARAQALAGHLQRLWEQTLPAMLPAIGEGRVAFEKVWCYAADANLSLIRKLEPLPFDPTELRLQPGGAFDGITLQAGPRPLVIPAASSWWLALDPTPLEPHGRSRFLGAPFTVWKERREAIRLRGIFLRKLVISGGVAHVPPTVELENGQSLDVFQETARAYDERLAGGLMLFPNDRDADGNYLYNYTEPPTLMDPTPLEAVIDGLDIEQLRSFGIPEKTVVEGQAVGSFAMVGLQMLTLYAVIEDLLSQFENSFQRYVIDKHLAANFDAGTLPDMTIAHEPLADRPDSLVAEIVKAAVTAQQLPPLFADGTLDIDRLLTDAGLPVQTEQ